MGDLVGESLSNSCDLGLPLGGFVGREWCMGADLCPSQRGVKKGKFPTSGYTDLVMLPSRSSALPRLT
jgi:hypothetical protein